jgi:preprotein translocase subunit SecD
VVLAPERPASDAVLDQLVKLLRVRTVRIAGESSITVTAAGGQVTLTGGADQAAAMRALANPGTLLLRPVLATKTPLPTPVNASEKQAEDAFGALDCSWSDPTRPLAAAGDYLAACAQSGSSPAGNDKGKYLLGPAALSDKDVKDVQASQSNGSWGVDITLDAAGSKAMADLSAAAAGQQADGTNSIAVVLDDVVYEAPTVSSAITDGQLRLSTVSQTFAEQDAAVWNVGTLPLRLVSSTVTGG